MYYVLLNFDLKALLKKIFEWGSVRINEDKVGSRKIMLLNTLMHSSGLMTLKTNSCKIAQIFSFMF